MRPPCLLLTATSLPLPSQTACTLSACAPHTDPFDCLFPPSAVVGAPAGYPHAGGGAGAFAAFGSVHLTLTSSEHQLNSFWPSVLCFDGSVPLPRPKVTPCVGGKGGREDGHEGEGGRSLVWRPEEGEEGAAWLDATDPVARDVCPLLSATLEGRARTESEEPVCPHGLAHCNGYRLNAYVAAGPTTPNAPMPYLPTTNSHASAASLIMFGVIMALFMWPFANAASGEGASNPRVGGGRHTGAGSAGAAAGDPNAWSMARRVRTAVSKPAVDLISWASTWAEVIDSQSDCPIWRVHEWIKPLWRACFASSHMRPRHSHLTSLVSPLLSSLLLGAASSRSRLTERSSCRRVGFTKSAPSAHSSGRRHRPQQPRMQQVGWRTRRRWWPSAQSAAVPRLMHALSRRARRHACHRQGLLGLRLRRLRHPRRPRRLRRLLQRHEAVDYEMVLVRGGAAPAGACWRRRTWTFSAL